LNGGRCLSDGSISRREVEPKEESKRLRQKSAQRKISCPGQISEAQGGLEETSNLNRERWNLTKREICLTERETY
jgi:hypothetical protein